MQVNSRIKSVFDNLIKKDKKALITYITCGDPFIEKTYELVLEMEKAGASIIELGIPYSDPLADGEIIQRASARALSSGININDCLDLVKRLRKVTQIPLVFLTYFNPVFKYDTQEFINKCVEAGVDGLIIPDLPQEEKIGINNFAKDKPIDIISLVAPTSKKRIKGIVKNAQGFIYCVSSKGVTGKRKSFDTDLSEFINEVKSYTDIPLAIGFGISDRKTVEKLKFLSNGLIVGSAIIEKIEEGIEDNTINQRVFNFVQELCKGIV